MVEAGGSKTQLPTQKATTDDEEVKVDMDEQRFMYGTHAEFLVDFWSRIEGDNLNPLEKGLLDKLLEDPEENHSKIKDTLVRIKEKSQGYAARRLGKMIPLFD